MQHLRRHLRVFLRAAVFSVRVLHRIYVVSPKFLQDWIVQFFGTGTWLVYGSARRTVRGNLRALGGGSPRRVFVNFMRSFADFLSSKNPHLRPPLSLEKEDLFRKTMAQGKGLVLVTAHLGQWELGAHVLDAWGIPATGIYQPYQNSAWNDFIHGHRAKGVRWVAVGHGAMRQALKALRAGQVVLVMGDTLYGEEGHPTTLLGRPFRLSRGPAILALRSGAPLMPVFLVREGSGYRALIQDPIWPEGAKLEDLVEHFRKRLEQTILKYPEQWYRFRLEEAAVKKRVPLEEGVRSPA